MPTLFEHDTSAFPWTDTDVVTLAELRAAVGSEVLTAEVRDGERVLRAGSFVGVVRVGGKAIQVLPKLFRPADADAARPAAAGRTVLAMLPYAFGLSVRRAADAPLDVGRLGWFEALVRAFAAGLAAEWGRGPARGYEPIEDERAAVRGRLRVREHLTRPARPHRLPVTFDEFTADTRLNRTFRFVVERLWERSADPANRRLLGGLRDRMGEVTLPPAVPPSAAPPTLVTRLTARFGPLFALARLFLAHLVPLPAAGAAPGWAFVLDMNRLFEGFLLGFLARHRAAALPPGLAGCRLLPQAEGVVRSLAERDDRRPVFRLRPDLVFASGGAFPVLADAKYKPLAPAAADAGVGQADFYQAAAYAGRYDCRRVVLLYPQLTADRVRAGFRLADGRRVEAATVELRNELWTSDGRRRLMNELRDLFTEPGHGH